MKYDFAAIEKKWQDRWEESKPYAAVTGDPRPKFFGLIEFPYPSGAGLHVGHPRPFTAIDIVTRKKRMDGYNVLFPIGYDAFGLPTENYAIKNHIHPAIVTRDNIANFTRQLKMLGYGFDWDRCVDTTDPKYYKWTQWIFLQMFKKGLAYKTTMPINWCTSCKCGLANEEVVEGVCERCGSPVVRKEKSQWMLRITKYADRLIDDLDDLDYIERVKVQQKNWIGRSTGCEVTFKTNTPDDITVYTTRADTLFGTTYMVISPEHPLLKKWQDRIENWEEVVAYQEAASRKSDFERGELNKEKTGVQLKGIEVLNPVTGKSLPMFVSDYVLMGYGTGIVMGVPGHDQRDWEFATKFGLPIIEVVSGGDVTKEEADLLYIALSTDCGCFQYGNTDASALRHAAELVEAGADNARLNQLFFRKVSAARIQLEGLIYNNMSFYRDGKVVVAIVTDEMLREAHATEDDCDDLAGLAGRAECGEVSITIRDYPGGHSKVSVRSGESFDSCALCARFGGGGHKMAAGCNLPVPPQEARELLLRTIDEVLA